MKDPRSIKKIRLTLDQEDLISRVAESLRNGDQRVAKEHWSRLIESLGKSTRSRVSERDVNHLIWQAISKARLAAEITKATSPEVLENEIKGWEEKLNTVGDDAQLANVDLQNVLQKQQQTLQMLSNISKMLYDTALSVIRKMGGGDTKARLNQSVRSRSRKVS